MKLRRRKGRGRHTHYSGGPEGSTVEELAAQLAPPEEQARAAGGGGGGNGAQHAAGSIVVDDGAFKMPEGFATRKRESRFEVGRVVVFVTLLMLLFTAFIAWQITRMPEDEPLPVRVVDEK
jgi:hypothetical protein